MDSPIPVPQIEIDGTATEMKSPRHKSHSISKMFSKKSKKITTGTDGETLEISESPIRTPIRDKENINANTPNSIRKSKKIEILKQELSEKQTRLEEALLRLEVLQSSLDISTTEKAELLKTKNQLEEKCSVLELENVGLKKENEEWKAKMEANTAKEGLQKWKEFCSLQESPPNSLYRKRQFSLLD
eukprot:TRINITY_DN2472_c0_g1_i1.p1 TRINITY_DN2472_c0_g1~~TRINITY_DN2472_c0_g1_i1.p1  ORF type:complete len:187 (-),score=47.90 TRINITY_DN2472_c0_g1_i1:2-562(-)